jgi:hypothetical protein
VQQLARIAKMGLGPLAALTPEFNDGIGAQLLSNELSPRAKLALIDHALRSCGGDDKGWIHRGPDTDRVVTRCTAQSLLDAKVHILDECSDTGDVRGLYGGVPTLNKVSQGYRH